MRDFQPTPFGKYLLLERIGTGGMAEIFRAKTFGAAGFEKEYAIKRILPNLGVDDEFVEMFVHEAKLVVDLYHANIVQVFDLGQIDGAYFIAMEFVYGKDLLDLLARCAETGLKIPLKLTLFIAMDMLKGLDFAHKAMDKFGEPLKIIHRDVSPSNIMLSYAGDVKVGDFGVAKAKSQTPLTQVGTLKGKVGYMSPEQVRGDEIDHRSDVFAAGIILYETLTMSRLFLGSSDLDVMLKIRDADIEEDLARCKRVPPTLLDIVRRALSKEVEDRFQTGEELYAALRDFTFTHHIKTSSRDLASFLHRVFDDEIEAEKTRRRQDPVLPSAPSQLEQRQRAKTPVAAPALRSEPQTDPRLARKAAITGEPFQMSEVTGKLVVETHYRFKDQSGRVYGPMTLPDLEALLSTRPAHGGEAVSIGTSAWRGPDDFPELWGVKRPTRPVISIPAGDSTKPGLDERPDFEGDLGDVTLTRLLHRLTMARKTGMLRIEGAVHHKEVFLRRGDPVLVTSSMHDELLGTYLLRRQLITEDELTRALERLTEFGGRLGDTLVAERILPTHDLFRYLAEQLQDRILNLFTWNEGRWSWTAKSRPPHQAVPLGIMLPELILEGVRNFVPLGQIQQMIQAFRDTPLEAQGGELDVDLDDEEASIRRKIQPDMTPREIIAGLTELHDETRVWRTLYLLLQTEQYSLGPDTTTARLP